MNRATGFAAAFTNLRTGERCDNENALLAAILADATNLGLAAWQRPAMASPAIKLVWTADAYIRPETYQAALARIIDAHHALPIAAIWGDGSNLVVGWAVLPLRQARRRRRRGQRALRPRSGPRLLHPSSPTSTVPTCHASCRRPATRRHMCSTG